MVIVAVVKEAEAPEGGRKTSDNRGIGNKIVLTLVSYHQSKLATYK